MENPRFEPAPSLGGEEQQREAAMRKREREDRELHITYIIKELEEPLASMFADLRSEIERGDYSAIIGDDASGRIPALIMWEVVKEIYKKKGFKPPLMRFIAGSSNIRFTDEEIKKEKEMDNQMARIKEDTGQNKKFLIVTDTISSGASVGMLIGSLKRNGLHADVATVGLVGPSIADNDEGSNRKELEDEWGSRIVYGMKRAPHIYREGRVSGVQKESAQLFSEPYLSYFGHIGGNIGNQQEINYAREVAHEVAQNLLKRFPALR